MIRFTIFDTAWGPFAVVARSHAAGRVRRRRMGGHLQNQSGRVRDVLKAEQRRRRWRDEVDAKLAEALDSGPPIEVTPSYWRELRRDARRRAGVKKSR